MQAPVEITFRDMAPSAAVEAAVRRWVERLERNFERIERCAVVIEIPHRHQRQGQTFRVHVDVMVPGKLITASRDSSQNQAHENVYAAMADAFVAARRQLRDYAQVLRGHVKSRGAA